MKTLILILAASAALAPAVIPTPAPVPVPTPAPSRPEVRLTDDEALIVVQSICRNAYLTARGTLDGFRPRQCSIYPANPGQLGDLSFVRFSNTFERKLRSTALARQKGVQVDFAPGLIRTREQAIRILKQHY